MKVCSIGYGRRGKTLIGELAAVTDVEVGGVYDPYEQNVGTLRPYGDVENMLLKERPDIVLDVTPPQFRFENILACEKHGVSLICEKPLLFTKRQDVILGRIKINVYPAYQLEFDTFIGKAFEIAEKLSIHSIELSQRVSLTAQGWRQKREIALGGCLLDNGSHLIQLIVQRYGMPERVSARFHDTEKGIERSASATLVYPHVVCGIHTDWMSPVGKETKITLVGQNQEVSFVGTNEGVRLWQSSVTHRGNWSTRKELHFYERRGLERDIKNNPHNQTNYNPTRRMLSFFVEDVRKRKGTRSAYARSAFKTALLTSRVIHKLYGSENSAGGFRYEL
jgi:predicted dehydrogenase